MSSPKAKKPRLKLVPGDEPLAPAVLASLPPMPPLPEPTSPVAVVLKYYGDEPGRARCYLERTEGPVLREAYFGDRTEPDAMAWAAALHAAGLPIIREDVPAPESGPDASRTRRTVASPSPVGDHLHAEQPRSGKDG